MDSINWKKGDLEIRTIEKGIDRTYPYVELIKWNSTDGEKRWCYVVAYFRRDSDGYYNLIFVGDRPFTDIAELDVQEVWKELFLTQLMLNGDKEDT